LTVSGRAWRRWRRTAAPDRDEESTAAKYTARIREAAFTLRFRPARLAEGSAAVQ